jgi:hypothetical protein
VQDETYSGSECVNMWNCCLLYPIQNSVGSLADFSANRGLVEAAIAYDTPSESEGYVRIS